MGQKNKKVGGKSGKNRWKTEVSSTVFLHLWGERKKKEGAEGRAGGLSTGDQSRAGEL